MKFIFSLLTGIAMILSGFTARVFPLNENEKAAEINENAYTVSEKYSDTSFTENDSVNAYVLFSELDELGRAQTAQACLGPELLPSESRATRMSFKPTGWKQECYDVIPEEYLYNRCHLIAYCLCGDEGSPENLITGTAWLNIQEMLPVETEIVRYISRTGNHVLYRVTPAYYGNDLVAYGVLVEAYSVEDKGGGICISELLYNVQPGIVIDYSDGSSRLE